MRPGLRAAPPVPAHSCCVVALPPARQLLLPWPCCPSHRATYAAPAVSSWRAPR